MPLLVLATAQVLLDNINTAPPDVMERLNSLFEDSPSLHLYEAAAGDHQVLSREARTIHPAFRLFATCDAGRVSANKLSKALLNRVVRICLLPLDSDLTPTNADTHDLWHLLVHRFGGVPGGYELASLCVRFHARMLAAAQAGQLQLIGGAPLTARTLLHAADGTLATLTWSGCRCSAVEAASAALMKAYLPGLDKPEQQAAVLHAAADVLQAPDLAGHVRYEPPPMAAADLDAWQQQGQELESRMARLEAAVAEASWLLVPCLADTQLAVKFAKKVCVCVGGGWQVCGCRNDGRVPPVVAFVWFGDMVGWALCVPVCSAVWDSAAIDSKRDHCGVAVYCCAPGRQQAHEWQTCGSSELLSVVFSALASSAVATFDPCLPDANSM